MTKIIPNGSPVKIDQGFGVFTYGVIKSYDATTKNSMGHRGNYMVRLTGGLDCFNKPAKLDSVIQVLATNVSPK